MRASVLAPVARDTIETLLRELIDEVKGLRADLSGGTKRERPDTLSRADRAQLGRLLPAIGGALGSDPFLARDLFEHESAGVRLVLRGLNARKVGRLLQRGEGHAIDGYLIQRDGLELHAVLWRVVQVPEFSGDTNLQVPPRAPRGLP